MLRSWLNSAHRSVQLVVPALPAVTVPLSRARYTVLCSRAFHVSSRRSCSPAETKFRSLLEAGELCQLSGAFVSLVEELHSSLIVGVDRMNKNLTREGVSASQPSPEDSCELVEYVEKVLTQLDSAFAMLKDRGQLDVLVDAALPYFSVYETALWALIKVRGKEGRRNK